MTILLILLQAMAVAVAVTEAMAGSVSSIMNFSDGQAANCDEAACDYDRDCFEVFHNSFCVSVFVCIAA